MIAMIARANAIRHKLEYLPEPTRGSRQTPLIVSSARQIYKGQEQQRHKRKDNEHGLRCIKLATASFLGNAAVILLCFW